MSLTAALVGTVAGLLVPAVMQPAIDQALDARSSPLAPYVWTLAGLTSVAWLAGLVSRRLMLGTSARIEFDLRTALQRHLGRQSIAFHDRVETGQLISRANSDLRVIQLFLVFAPAALVLYLGAAVALVIMVRTHAVLTLVTLAPMPFVIWAGIRMRRVMFPLSWLVQARRADLATLVEQNLSGAHVVRAMGAEVEQIRQVDESVRALRWASEREVAARSRYEPLLAAIPQTGTALFLLIAGWLATNGTVTIGAIVLFTGYIGLLQFPLRTVGFLVMMGQRARAASARILELFDQEAEVRDVAAPTKLPSGAGGIRFERTSFAYNGDTPALRDVTVTVEAGETVAVVGPTGAGKSTLLSLVSRLHDATCGRVLVGGVDVRHVSQASLRRHVGIALQEAFLFTTSIRQNIAYARPDADPDEIRQAADMAGALDFIEALPRGFETVVGERGYTLSGGQRQRIAIARLLVQDPGIVLLDDATSAVDVEVEHRILGSLSRALAGRTTLVVAHRPATIGLADRVIFLDNGRLVAEGTHDDLLATEPRYAEVLASPTEARGERSEPREKTADAAPDLPGLPSFSIQELGR